MTLSEALTYISDWFNRHKSILILLGMPLGAAATFAYDNVVLKDEFQSHLKYQSEINNQFAKSISVLDYESQLSNVQEEIDFILEDTKRADLSDRELRKLERLERAEERLEKALSERKKVNPVFD